MSDPQKSSISGVMPRHIRIGMLLDVYGNLLTDRQREFVQLHYDEDQSFGEIAQVKGVSRQAVHDAVKHAEKSLEQYERKLCLLERGWPKILTRIQESPLPKEGESAGAGDLVGDEWILEALDNEGPAGKASGEAEEPAIAGESASGSPKLDAVLEPVENGLLGLRKRILRSGGIIYDADGLLTEVNRLLSQVRETRGRRASEQGGSRDV